MPTANTMAPAALRGSLSAMQLAFESMARLLPSFSVRAEPPARHWMIKGVVTRIQRPQGRIIACQTGALWLNHEGESEDIVLEAGDKIRLVKSAALVVSTLKPATWRVW